MALDLEIPLNPLLFLSRHYGDMTGQPDPVFDGFPDLALDAPWHTLGLDEMSNYVRRFAAVVAEEILATGVRVDVWNLGNEVDFGVAGVTVQPIPMDQWNEVDGTADWYRGPDAIDPAIGGMSANALFEMPLDDRIAWLAEHVWAHEARLFAAAAEGVRSVDAQAKFCTHLGNMPVERGWASAFFRAMKDGGYEFDMTGLSGYPSMLPDANTAFSNEKDELVALMSEFGMPAMVQEYNYPAGHSEETFADAGGVIDGYPHTEDGQAKMLEDFVVWGIGEGLAGINPWGPDLIWPVWEKMTFFRVEGTQAIARPALWSYEKAVQHAGAVTEA
jgi:arabinogalactan endo-1,4-beta-galactosidase